MRHQVLESIVIIDIENAKKNLGGTLVSIRFKEVNIWNFKGSTRGSTVVTHNYNVKWVKIHGESNLFLEDNDLVGVEGPKQELMDLLMMKDRNRIVISVLGMGGLGKTTLVANIFNNADVKQRFCGCCMWITVLQTTLTVQDILKHILKGLVSSGNGPAMSYKLRGYELQRDG